LIAAIALKYDVDLALPEGMSRSGRMRQMAISVWRYLFCGNFVSIHFEQTPAWSCLLKVGGVAFVSIDDRFLWILMLVKESKC
jgi:hypothetical protein